MLRARPTGKDYLFVSIELSTCEKLTRFLYQFVVMLSFLNILPKITLAIFFILVYFVNFSSLPSPLENVKSRKSLYVDNLSVNDAGDNFFYNFGLWIFLA